MVTALCMGNCPLGLEERMSDWGKPIDVEKVYAGRFVAELDISILRGNPPLRVRDASERALLLKVLRVLQR